MPRLRPSGGTKSLLSVSTKGVSPTEMAPLVGCSSPAMQFSVVDLPHPLGPRRVKNSPSLMVKSTLSRTTLSPKTLLRFETLTSGISVVSFQEESGEPDEGCGDGDLDGCEGGDGAGVALDPELEHRRADDVGVGGSEEDGRRVLLEHGHERQDQGSEEGRGDELGEDHREGLDPVG